MLKIDFFPPATSLGLRSPSSNVTSMLAKLKNQILEIL